MIAGIDIGTSFSSISIRNNAGEIKNIQVSNGLSMIGDDYCLPSAVYVTENNEILVGQAAMQVRFKNPASFKDEFKRNLGENDPYQLGNFSLYPEDLYKEIYTYLKARAERAIGEKIEKAYITYPVTFSKAQKDLVRKAAKNSGLLIVELIEEPVAAARCYCEKENLPNSCTLLIYDFGGGTFDATVVKYSNGGFEVCGRPSGLEDCGGSNIDEIIRLDILSQIEKRILDSIEENPKHKQMFYSTVSEAAVRVKHLLSEAMEHTEIIPIGLDVVEYNIKRVDFEKKIYGLVNETLECMLSAIKQANLEIKDIDMVIPVGGSSQIPLVQKMLIDTFGKEKLRNNADYKLAVCIGAVMMEKDKRFNQATIKGTNKAYINQTQEKVPVATNEQSDVRKRISNQTETRNIKQQKNIFQFQNFTSEKENIFKLK